MMAGVAALPAEWHSGKAVAMHSGKGVARFFRASSAAVEVDRFRLFRATSAAGRSEPIEVADTSAGPR